MSAITVGLFTAICILKSATAQDLITTCPASGFTEGVQLAINCTVNRNFYDTTCLTPPALVTFMFSIGGSTTPWCDTSYTACETTGQSQTACNGCSCKCSNENPTTNINKYSLSFVPNTTYNGGSFYCDITCTFPSSPETTDHSSCENVTVAVNSNTTEGPSPGEIVGITVAAFCVSGGGVAVAVAAVRYKNRRVLYTTLDKESTEEKLKGIKTESIITCRTATTEDLEFITKELESRGLPSEDMKNCKTVVEISWKSAQAEAAQTEVEEAIKWLNIHYLCRNGATNIVKS